VESGGPFRERIRAAGHLGSFRGNGRPGEHTARSYRLPPGDAKLGALRDDVDVEAATDLLWLHLCNAAYFIRTDDLGWSLDRSEAWLNEALPHALLRRP
jgi:hypothetical protein